MKKNHIVSCLAIIVVLVSCISCAFGADKMDKNYLVTVNGIEMYDEAAIKLLGQISTNERELVSIVNNDTKENLDVGAEILKPGMDILINDSKNMRIILDLFETIKPQIKKSKSEILSGVIYKDKDVLIMKFSSGEFSISSNYKAGDKNFLLCVNEKLQITKIIPIVVKSQSDTEFVTPIHE